MNNLNNLDVYNCSGSEFTVSAPGKVILHGEHSVVYGKLAVAASLGLRTYLSFKKLNSESSNPNKCQIKFDALDLSYKINLEQLKSVLLDAPLPLLGKTTFEFNWREPEAIDRNHLISKIESFIKESVSPNDDGNHLALLVTLFLFTGITASVDFNLSPFLLTIKSDVEPGAGTGSSASFSVCLAAAFLQYIKSETLNKDHVSKPSYKNVSWSNTSLLSFTTEELDMICKWAYQGECLLHGTPSGVDNTVCTSGSFVLFRRGTPPRTLQKSGYNLKILLINTKVGRETKVQVQKLAQLRSKYENIVDGIIDVLDKVAATAVEHLEMLGKLTAPSGGDCFSEDFMQKYRKLEGLVDINQNLLRALGVSHPSLDDICSILAEYQLHGKLTGAGGGGNAICYIPPSYEQVKLDKVLNVLKDKGYEASCVDLGGDGVRIESC